ncbi:glycoside hydrolase family 3 N-terminal domain-containing protein [Cytophaga hutchinsonii]|uniref:beta-glucosidase n=1 Tax=Cytophaga hutchinsonii (strain ATCC 33406 / DSM 1761 / CIP 103989 / NBRC 15051 / NCIMB 9469 / D465) TaxID=269798 RepID=A0A6N4STA7_CYTH3|nr:glycoside hydrolase family 3 N-terminal domain-containing protein [Cytophaga hutchinsonii]ABG59531.1 b-glucosidase, glycoside hydrolase family 3 protein [Cytophaga hutchinsonii ATCC 33406]SFX94953.1 beta-glucosidase [Cytophaga hutchinsonii ATCC 33406]
MKKITVLISIWLSAAAFFSCEKKTEAGSKPQAFDKEVQDLLKNMSLEEKAGQMTQIDIRNLLNNGYGNTDEKLDTARLKEAIQTYHVGSILNCIQAYTPEKWVELISQIQNEALQSPNKIPVLYGTDAMHGVGFIKDAVLFPHNIGMAASRNDQLVSQAAQVTSTEARSVGLTWNFAPVLDVGREPYWSRFEETFGEDVYITTQMGSAAVQMMEGSDLTSKTNIASCLKHFIGYSAPKNGIDRTQSHIPEIVLREYYLPPFREAINKGASSIMINSAEINGIPCHGNKWLLTDLLRTELGFTGMVVSDWEDVIRLHTWHKVAATPKEAVMMAVNAGVDMSMVPNDYSFPKYLVELVKEGKVSMARIDEAVGRILTLKIKLGLMKNPLPSIADVGVVGSDAHQQIALNAARESITLLKNDKNILPLAKDKKILLVGPAANSLSALHSSWSYTWQGSNESLYPETTKTIREALEASGNKANIRTNATTGFDDAANYDVSFIQKNTAGVDVIIVCVGEAAYAEQPGVIKDLNLPEAQKQLIVAAKKTGKPVIVCLVEGRPRLFPEEEALADAVIMCYRPGSKGADAFAEILYGDINPSGKLPFTYPRYDGDITTYDYKFKETEQQLKPGVSEFVAFNPQWPFGHGLSYTTFAYSNLNVNKSNFTKNDSVLVTVDISNTGARTGKIAVELYSRDHFASITPSERRLRKYTKIELKAGEKQTVSFTIKAADLQFVNKDLKTVTEAGAFDLMIGNLQTEIYFNE